MTDSSPHTAQTRNYRFVTDDDSHCYAVVWTGEVTVAALKAFYDDVVTLPAFPSRRGVVHDLRGARFAVDFGDLDMVRVDHGKMIHADGSKPRLAFVVDSTLQFGQMRQVITKVRIDNEVLVTRSEDEAKAFVGLPADIVLAGDG